MNRHNSSVLDQIPPSLSRSLLNVARNAVVGNFTFLDLNSIPIDKGLCDRIAHISLSLCLVGLGNGWSLPWLPAPWRGACDRTQPNIRAGDGRLCACPSSDVQDGPTLLPFFIESANGTDHGKSTLTHCAHKVRHARIHRKPNFLHFFFLLIGVIAMNRQHHIPATPSTPLLHWR